MHLLFLNEYVNCADLIWNSAVAFPLMLTSLLKLILFYLSVYLNLPDNHQEHREAIGLSAILLSYGRSRTAKTCTYIDVVYKRILLYLFFNDRAFFLIKKDASTKNFNLETLFPFGRGQLSSLSSFQMKFVPFSLKSTHFSAFLYRMRVCTFAY